MTSKNP